MPLNTWLIQLVIAALEKAEEKAASHTVRREVKRRTVKGDGK